MRRAQREDAALMRLVEARVLRDSGNLTPVDDVIRALGYDDLLDPDISPAAAG